MCARVVSIKPAKKKALTKKAEPVKKAAPAKNNEPLEEYKQQVLSGTISAIPYDRLMIHLRKEKDYDEELKIIKKGISTLKKYYSELQQTSLKKINPKIRELSKKFGKSTGLIDTKGNDVYLPEPLPRWIKRQEMVEAKIKNFAVPKKKKKKTR